MQQHLTTAQLEAGVAHIRRAPRAVGAVELIVARPAVDAREVLDAAELSHHDGLVGDGWRTRDDNPDGPPDLDTQITVMSARAIGLIAQDPSRWPLAGDQLYVDMDISGSNLPAGTQLALGTAVLVVTPQPHRGCAKFAQRFGRDALRFVNSPVGRDLRLRGLNARVVQPGTVRRGDTVRKL